MPPLGLLLDDLLPSSCIRLGRLVLNTKIPHQDYLDPLGDRPAEAEYKVHRQENFEETWRSSRNSKLRSYLTNILSVSYGTRNARISSLTAPQITTHLLMNSGAWFGEACSQPETRTWIENAVDCGKTVYLVVGFRILEDARIARNVTWEVVQGARAEVSASAVVGPSAIALNTASPGVGGTQDASYEQRRVFDAPGENIFAVQYRKVKFRWLSSQTASNPSLDKTRWKSSLEWRGSDNEDEEEEEDILEVELTDASDQEFLDEEDINEDVTADSALPPQTPSVALPDSTLQHSDPPILLPQAAGPQPSSPQPQ